MLNTKFNAVIHQIECIKISVMKSLKSIDLSKLLIYHFLGFVTAVHCFCNHQNVQSLHIVVFILKLVLIFKINCSIESNIEISLSCPHCEVRHEAIWNDLQNHRWRLLTTVRVGDINSSQEVATMDCMAES